MKSNFLRVFATLVILSLFLPSSSIQARQALASQEVVSDGDPDLPEGLTSSEWQSIQNQILSNISQQAYFKASNTDADDWFSWSVAVYADTVVVGAPQEDSAATGVNGNQSDNSATQSGAAYVFVRSGAAWTQQAYLKASNTNAYDYFGISVAISNDTIVVGASGEASAAKGVNGDQNNNSASGSGAAYVFVRSGAAWSQQAYLKASNTGAWDRFGWSVAISNDTIVVGAIGEASAATGVNGNQSDNSAQYAGAAYVFARSGAAWTQQAYLKASNTNAYDYFGYSVAISNDTIVVGADEESSAATGVNGNQSDNSAQYAGAAYVFARSGAAWTQQAYLKASNTGGGDSFGTSVAISNDTIVVGADGEASAATGVNGNQSDNSARDSGAAYVFVRIGAAWSQQAYLKASNTDVQDYFGISVAVSNDTIVVGANQESSAATGVNGDQNDNNLSASGAAYMFARSGTTWTQQAYLKASNTDFGDWFGRCVAVSNDTVVVSAYLESSAATGVNGNQSDDSAYRAGAAYAFVRDPSVPPVSITGIEINQALGVQKNNEQNYVAGKDAVIRVLMNQPVAINASSQSLEVKRGSTVLATLRPNNKPSSVNSIDFYISGNMTGCETCGLSEIYSFTANINGQTISKTVNFQKTDKIRILAVPMKVNYNGEILSLPDDQWKTAWKLMASVYPLANDGIEWVLYPEELDMTAWDLKTWGSLASTPYLVKLRNLNNFGCWSGLPNDCFDKIVGFIPPVAFGCSTSCGDQCGCLGGFTNSLFSKASVVMTNGSFISGCDNQPRDLKTMRAILAHEIGHNFGLGDEYNNPFATLKCEVNPSPPEYIGYKFSLITPPSCSSSDSCSDMSVQPWPYDTGTGSLISKDLIPYEINAVLPGSSPRGWLDDSISFMGNGKYLKDVWVTQDIYSHLFNEMKQSPLFTNNNIQTTGRILNASGLIGLDNSVSIGTWYSSDGTLPEASSGAYSISAVDDTNTILASQGFDVSFQLLSDPPILLESDLFDVVVPFPEGTTKFVIKNGSTIIATKYVSAGLPSVQIVSPNGGETWSSNSTYEITWSGSDPDGDALEYALTYSPDGIKWLPLATDLTGTTYTINPDNLPGGTQALVRVIASDGINTTEDQSDESFIVSGKSPEANIFYPNNNDIIPFGLSVLLDGSGYDPEDEMISGESVSWTSDVDGLLGNGANLQVDLSYGYHTLTMEVQDSDGNTSQKSVTVFIGSKVYLPTVSR